MSQEVDHNGSIEMANSNGNNNEQVVPPDDIEANNAGAVQQETMEKVKNTAPKNLEPMRTDPVKALEVRKRRLDRQAALMMPEIHFVGQIVSGVNLTADSTEGAFCRWKIEHGKAWQHLGGDTFGQTQVAYCRMRETESLPFNHPVDVHFAEAGLQVIRLYVIIV